MEGEFVFDAFAFFEQGEGTVFDFLHFFWGWGGREEGVAPGCGTLGADGTGTGEEVAVVEFELATREGVAGVDVGDCDFGVFGDGVERADVQAGTVEGDDGVGGAGVVDEGD